MPTPPNPVNRPPAAHNATPPPPDIALVIPAYNESGSIAAVIAELQATLAATESDYTYEIIVVNDGSRDDTGAILDTLGGIRVIHHQANRGYGAALKTGIRAASAPLIVITDADRTYPNERIPELVTYFHAASSDMVVGARTGETVKIPLVRRPAKWVIRQLAAVVAGQPIPDLNSGLRVFRRDLALRFFNLLPNGFSFTTTITLGMLTNAYKVDYVPINYHARVGQSKIKPIRDTLNFLILILRVSLYFEPLKVFLPVSGFILVFAVVWGVGSHLFLAGGFADDSTFVLVLSAVQIAMLGLLAELINHRLPSHYRDDEPR